MLLVLEINLNLIPVYTDELGIKTIFIAQRLKIYKKINHLGFCKSGL